MNIRAKIDSSNNLKYSTNSLQLESIKDSDEYDNISPENSFPNSSKNLIMIQHFNDKNGRPSVQIVNNQSKKYYQNLGVDMNFNNSSSEEKEDKVNLIPQCQMVFEPKERSRKLNSDNKMLISIKRRVSDFTMRNFRSLSTQNLLKVDKSQFDIDKGNKKNCKKGGTVDLSNYIGDYQTYKRKRSELNKYEEETDIYIAHLNELCTTITKIISRKIFKRIKRLSNKIKKANCKDIIKKIYMLKNNGVNIKFKKCYYKHCYIIKRNYITKKSILAKIKHIQFSYRKYKTYQNQKKILSSIIKKYPSFLQSTLNKIKKLKSHRRLKSMPKKQINPITENDNKNNNQEILNMIVIKNEEINITSTPKKPPKLDIISHEKDFCIKSPPKKKENTRYNSYEEHPLQQPIKNEIQSSLFPLKKLSSAPVTQSLSLTKLNLQEINDNASLSSTTATLLNNTNLNLSSSPTPLATLRKNSINNIKNLVSKKNSKRSRNKISLNYIFKSYPPHMIVYILNRIAKLTNKLKFLLAFVGIITKSIQESTFYIIRNKGTPQSINFYYRTIKKHYDLVTSESNRKNPHVFIMKLFLHSALPLNDYTLSSWRYFNNRKEIESNLLNNVYDKDKDTKSILSYLRTYISFYLEHNASQFDALLRCITQRYLKEFSHIKNFSIFGISRYIDNFIKRFYDGMFCADCNCQKENEICRCKCHYDNGKNIIGDFYEKTVFDYDKKILDNFNYLIWDEDCDDITHKKGELDKRIKRYNKGFKDNIGFISLVVGKDL